MAQFNPASIPIIGLDSVNVGVFSAEGFGVTKDGAAAQNGAAFREATTAAEEAGGGTITLTVPGEYESGSFGLPNNVTLEIGNGVKLIRGANTNAPLIKNKDAAYLILATQFNRLSNVVTVNDASHTFGAGQKIYLPPSRFTDTTFGGLVTIAATTSGTWSYASAGSNGAGGTSIQYIPAIPITRSIAPSNLATVAVNAINYIRVTDSVGDLPIGTQVYITSDNAADSGFIGLVDVAVVTPTGWVFKVPNNTAGVPAGNLQLNYSVGVSITGNGVIDGNHTGQVLADIMRSNPVLLSNVSHCRVDGGIRVMSSNARAINFFNPSNVYIDCFIEDTKVGVQFEGGYKKITINRLSGMAQQNTAWDGSATKQLNDDFCAFTNTIYTGTGVGGAQDYDNVSSPYGFSPSLDATINILECYGGGNGLKVTTDISNPTGTIKIGTIAMYGLDPNPGLLGTAVSVIDDGPHLSGTGYREITVDRVVWDMDYLGTISYRHLSHTAGGNCGRLIFRNIKDQSATTGTNFLFQPGTSAVSSMTNNGTTCTIVHDGNRKYVAGQRIVITGVTSDTAWNGVWVVAGVTNSTTLTVTTSKASASTGTILMNGAVVEQFVCERAKTLPAASGSHSNWQFGLGAIDAIEINGWDVQQGIGTSTASIISLSTFYNQSLKITDVTYSAVTTNTGAPVIALTGNHKNIHLDNWRPRGTFATSDTTNAAGFAVNAILRFLNTVIPQTTNIYVSNSVLRSSSIFGDNAVALGATTLNFFFDNTECLTTTANNVFQFAGSTTTQLNVFASESCKFPTSQGFFVAPNIRVNGPIYTNLSALAGKFTGQVDGDTCISTTAVGGLPGGNTLSATATTDGTTVTVTATAHGFVTGQRVTMSGVTSNTGFNGNWTITNTGANTFTFTLVLAGPVTGTIVVTGATRVRWSQALGKWMSINPIASGSTPLVGGTFTVTTPMMQATSEVRIRNRVTGGTPGAILPVTYTAGTNFVVTSTLGTDTSTLNWEMYGTN